MIVISLPSHTSHRIQPLDFGVFGPVKAKHSSVMRMACRNVKKIDVFTAADCIAQAFIYPMTQSNIVKSFEKTGGWVRCKGGPSARPLLELFPKPDGSFPTVEEFMASFNKSTLALVSHVDVAQEGTIRINTCSGAVLTAEVVLEALEKRETRRAVAIEKDGQSPFRKRAISKRAREEEEAELESSRKQRRMDLDASRSSRRAIRRLCASREKEGHSFNLQTGAPNN